MAVTSKFVHYYSLNLQVIVDANQKFIHITTGFAGSIHDTRILRMTSIYDLAENREILNEPPESK